MGTGWDEGCLTCVHEAGCAEIGGRCEGRGYGSACLPFFGEPPYYERVPGMTEEDSMRRLAELDQIDESYP